MDVLRELGKGFVNQTTTGKNLNTSAKEAELKSELLLVLSNFAHTVNTKKMSEILDQVNDRVKLLDEDYSEDVEE